jgi:hypothetical protein
MVPRVCVRRLERIFYMRINVCVYIYIYIYVYRRRRQFGLMKSSRAGTSAPLRLSKYIDRAFGQRGGDSVPLGFESPERRRCYTYRLRVGGGGWKSLPRVIIMWPVR